MASESIENSRKLENTWIYVDEDGIVNGLVQMEGSEIKTLYVNTFFKNQNIGAKLLAFAVKETDCNYLWVLDRNTRAISFYIKHGFHITEDKELEEGTTEYL